MHWAGLALGPAAWATNTQANYSLVPWFCSFGINLVPWLALAMTLASLLGALLSWWAWRASDGVHPRVPEQDGGPASFVSLMGVIAAILFAAVIASQGMAGLFLSGCER